MVLTSMSQFQPVLLRNAAGPGFVLTLTAEERDTEPSTPPADAPPTREQDEDEDEEAPI